MPRRARRFCGFCHRPWDSTWAYCRPSNTCWMNKWPKGPSDAHNLLSDIKRKNDFGLSASGISKLHISSPHFTKPWEKGRKSLWSHRWSILLPHPLTICQRKFMLIPVKHQIWSQPFHQVSLYLASLPSLIHENSLAQWRAWTPAHKSAGT